MPRSRTLALTGLSAALLCAALAAASANPADVAEAAVRAQAVNPLSTIEPAEWTARGTITQTLSAGHYTYAALTPPGQPPLWIVTSGQAPSPGQRVEARIFGTARGFHSRRLDRRFEALHFASIETSSR